MIHRGLHKARRRNRSVFGPLHSLAPSNIFSLCAVLPQLLLFFRCGCIHPAWQWLTCRPLRFAVPVVAALYSSAWFFIVCVSLRDAALWLQPRAVRVAAEPNSAAAMQPHQSLLARSPRRRCVVRLCSHFRALYSTATFAHVSNAIAVRMRPSPKPAK